MKTLCIIDMQNGFIRPTKRNLVIIENCCNLIQEFINKDYHIISMTYRRFGRVVTPIQELLRDYHKVFHVEKSEMSGANEIHKILLEKQIATELHVCGVNWNQCLASTVCNLIGLNDKVYIVAHQHASNPEKFTNEQLWKKSDRILIKLC